MRKGESVRKKEGEAEEEGVEAHAAELLGALVEMGMVVVAAGADDWGPVKECANAYI